MKRLLHILAQRPVKTGSATYLQAMMIEADKRDYQQAFVAALNEGEEYVFKGDNDISFYPVYFRSEELPFDIVGMTDIMPYESTKYSEMTEDMLRLWKKAFRKVITRVVNEFKPDVIISHHLWILTAYVKELFPDIKVAAICHGTDLRQLVLAEKFSGYVKDGCARLDYILALNDYQKDKIAAEYALDPGKIHVIGSGYNSYIFHRDECGVSLDTIELVYAGKLNSAKGVTTLIRAVNGLDFFNKKIRLTIAGTGNGPEAEAIYTAAKLCRHEVVFTGNLPQEKLSRLFRDSDIFILPSFYEGLPLVLIEALASGLRVVTTDLPGVKDWIGKEINRSGAIEYVELPAMKSIDVPYDTELPAFEKRLQEAIEGHFNRMLRHEEVCEDWVYDSIKKLSWRGVFDTMENILIKSIE
ncbi:MAG: glycosyltransferase family 4 protein [Clostridiaceae bacterium]